MRAPEIAKQILQGEPGIDDVLDDQHVAALDRGVEVLEDPHHAAGVGGRAVGGHGHEVDLARDLDLAHEIGEEEHRALEHADEQQIAVGVLRADLLAQGAHALLEVVGLDEDLADLGVAHQARTIGSGPGVQHRGTRAASSKTMTTIDHAEPRAGRRPAIHSDEHAASGALQVARRTVAGRAHRGVPEHGQRRRAGGPAVGRPLSLAAMRGVNCITEGGRSPRRSGRARRLWRVGARQRVERCVVEPQAQQVDTRGLSARATAGGSREVRGTTPGFRHLSHAVRAIAPAASLQPTLPRCPGRAETRTTTETASAAACARTAAPRPAPPPALRRRRPGRPPRRARGSRPGAWRRGRTGHPSRPRRAGAR